jgi:PHD/YefM family antitoxin component YafN of YafNO toxin-antitoxin module
MISLEDFTALEETAYLLRVPINARRLLEAIAELDVAAVLNTAPRNEAHLCS